MFTWLKKKKNKKLPADINNKLNCPDSIQFYLLLEKISQIQTNTHYHIGYLERKRKKNIHFIYSKWIIITVINSNRPKKKRHDTQKPYIRSPLLSLEATQPDRLAWNAEVFRRSFRRPIAAGLLDRVVRVLIDVQDATVRQKTQDTNHTERPAWPDAGPDERQ